MIYSYKNYRVINLRDLIKLLNENKTDELKNKSIILRSSGNICNVDFMKEEFDKTINLIKNSNLSLSQFNHGTFWENDAKYLFDIYNISTIPVGDLIVRMYHNKKLWEIKKKPHKWIFHFGSSDLSRYKILEAIKVLDIHFKENVNDNIVLSRKIENKNLNIFPELIEFKNKYKNSVDIKELYENDYYNEILSQSKFSITSSYREGGPRLFLYSIAMGIKTYFYKKLFDMQGNILVKEFLPYVIIYNDKINIDTSDAYKMTKTDISEIIDKYI